MPSLIDIIIRATWAGGQATSRAKKDLAGIDEGARKGGKGLVSFAAAAGTVTAALAATGAATKAFYSSLERGAGLQLTQKRFDNLTVSIGSTGDALDRQLGAATAGLISNAQRMALATDLIGLELATTEEQAIRLGRVVTELDQDTGELSLALVNQTTKRFDQLNISAVGFEARLKALEEQGYDTQAAFTEAFLQQAEAQIERVGGKSETAAGDLARFESSIQNVKDSAELTLISLTEFSGGLERIEAVGFSLNAISDALDELQSRLGTNQTPEAAISQAVTKAVVQTEAFKDVLRGVLFTVKLIGDAFQDDVDPGLAAAVAEAESFDRALMNINNTLTEITGKIQDVALPSRGASERGGDAGGRAGEIVNQQFGTIQERVDLFQDFQDDLTAINEAGLAEREQLEQTYEEARTAIVEAYGRQRAQEEEDWQRRQAREQRRYQRSVEETREQAAESEQEARQDANEALQKLEQDHLDTIQDIIRNADIQLRDAASRLDAKAVANIKTQRDEAIRSENRNFAKQQQALEQQLAEQLTTIQDNLKERLDDLKEFQEIRQAEEEEDREIRLNRLEESNQRELAELDGRYRESIQELKDSIREQRQEVTARYREEYIELTQSWDDREELQITRMAEILRLEEQWWSDRAAIIGGDATRNGTGGGGNGGVGGVDPTPTRAELLDMLENFARERGIPEGVISGLLRSVSGWSDERIAKYIERTFDIDIPGYAMGTPFVPRTGLALVHRGEEINPPGRRSYDNSRQIVVHPGAVQITAGPGMNEEQLGRIFERKMIDLFERV